MTPRHLLALTLLVLLTACATRNDHPLSQQTPTAVTYAITGACFGSHQIKVTFLPDGGTFVDIPIPARYRATPKSSSDLTEIADPLRRIRWTSIAPTLNRRPPPGIIGPGHLTITVDYPGSRHYVITRDLSLSQPLNLQLIHVTRIFNRLHDALYPIETAKP